MFGKLKIRASVFCLAVCLLAACGSAWAQYYNNPGLGQRPIASHPQDFKPLGVRAGAFMLHPGVQLAVRWTDNAFYADTDLRSDTIFHIRPYISAQSTWSRHSLNISLAADIARYAKYTERNFEDYFFGIGGRVDVKNRSYFNYSLDYMNLHEGLNNRDAEQGIEPTRFHSYGGSVGYSHTFTRFSLSATYATNWLDYDDVVGTDGEIIDNQDRDRRRSGVTLRAGYQFWLDKQLFISYTGYSVDYDQQYDRNGYDRSGDGYTINTGVSFTMTEILTGSVYASYYNRNFDDPRLPSNSGWRWVMAGNAGLTYRPSNLTTIYGRITGGIYDTSDLNSTSYLQTVYSLRIDHELLRNLQLNAFVSYSTNDYDSIDPTLENTRGKDKLTRAGVGFNWFINRHMYLNGSYNRSHLNSSLPNDDFTTNSLWLTLGLEY